MSHGNPLKKKEGSKQVAQVEDKILSDFLNAAGKRPPYTFVQNLIQTSSMPYRAENAAFQLNISYLNSFRIYKIILDAISATNRPLEAFGEWLILGVPYLKRKSKTDLLAQPSEQIIAANEACLQFLGNYQNLLEKEFLKSTQLKIHLIKEIISIFKSYLIEPYSQSVTGILKNDLVVWLKNKKINYPNMMLSKKTDNNPCLMHNGQEGALQSLPSLLAKTLDNRKILIEIPELFYFSKDWVENSKYDIERNQLPWFENFNINFSNIFNKIILKDVILKEALDPTFDFYARDLHYRVFQQAVNETMYGKLESTSE